MNTSILALVAHVALAQSPGSNPGLIQPPAFNWCGPDSDSYKKCTPPKFQGGCGSCWAFATTAVVENLIYLDDPSVVPDLSEQYLISCNTQTYNLIMGGCTGGFATFNMFVDSHRPSEVGAGAVYEADFPNKYKSVECGGNHPKHEKLQGWVDLPEGPDVRTIKEHISSYGPVYADVCTDEKFLYYSYKDGIYRGNSNPCIIANHAVVLVGWDDNNGDGYWILRNSYGVGWGNHGYMKIAYGANGVATHVTAAVYKPRYPLPPTYGCSSTGDAGVGFYVVLGLVVAYVMLSSSKRR